MKNLLFIILLAFGFSQTELTTRVYTIENYLFEYDEYSEWIYLEELTGYELDYAMVKLVDATIISGGCGFCEASENNTSLCNPADGRGQIGEDFRSSAYLITAKGDSWIKFMGVNGTAYADITFAITAPFPEEDTGYIEEGFEFCVSPGANLLSFPCDNPISVGASLPDGIENFIESIIGEGVATSYNPTLGWVGSLDDFDPGSGYWFKSNSSLCFEYDCVED